MHVERTAVSCQLGVRQKSHSLQEVLRQHSISCKAKASEPLPDACMHAAQHSQISVAISSWADNCYITAALMLLKQSTQHQDACISYYRGAHATYPQQ